MTIFIVIGILLVFVFRVVPIFLVNHHLVTQRMFIRRDLTLSDWFEYLVTFLNFIGVMFISRGVVLLRDDAKDLDAAVVNPNNFPGAVRDLIKKSSKDCELGVLFVAAAFVFDMVAKALS
ncbi:hypothetical protein [Paraburkholderia sp. SUR17]|uniref:hypothetical protein n=1 Tax=Paraburkholderia sp. SUR17 TaxID=3034358 RepID=UPI002407DC56|nr:hypothetical protein [Paraburkholderia sp. SUR17]WEY40074.1 hypothetical protein P2869_06875 [Paraburkholderia sp. SUR17]